MIRTVRTSQTDWPSAEGLDDFSSEGEWKRFDKFALVFDKSSPMMSGQCGHHVLMFQLPTDGVLSAVKLDAAMGPDLANPGDQVGIFSRRSMRPPRLQSKAKQGLSVQLSQRCHNGQICANIQMAKRSHSNVVQGQHRHRKR